MQNFPTKTIVLCGVGGQGTILAAHILAEAAISEGFDVKVSEIHGMAQRGGAVTTVVRFGSKVHSMISDKGMADAVVSFEMLEALRNLDQLKIGGTIIVNDEIIKPASVLTGKVEISPNIGDALGVLDPIIIPAENTAREAGNAKASNTVLLGALSSVCPFSEEAWEDAIRMHVPEKTIEVNLLAFRAGRAFTEEHNTQEQDWTEQQQKASIY